MSLPALARRGFQPSSRVAYPAIHQLMMHAQLRLAFSDVAGGTQLHCLQQDPPWKVVRAFPNPAGESLVHLNNVSGGIFGGDQLNLHVDVGPGAAAQITT